MTAKSYIQTWDDYWKIFNAVRDSLTARKETAIADALVHAQSYVNGMTDGWYEFYDRLDMIIGSNLNTFTGVEQRDLLELRNCLKATLKNR